MAGCLGINAAKECNNHDESEDKGTVESAKEEVLKTAGHVKRFGCEMWDTIQDAGQFVSDGWDKFKERFL